MKHGDLVQPRRRDYKRIVTGTRWSWYLDCEVETYDYIPEGWIYYGLPFRYRYDPVPGVKHWRNSFRDYYRHPQTTQERRLWYASEGYGRGKRSPRYLPHTWDDVCYARKERGWKRTKKKRQWMKKGDKSYEKINWNLLQTEGWM